jgi:catechol 2,3-dioxygenase-like lactoylglutathione lyase family enzyme
MIGRVRSVVIDSRDPRGLAEFWAKVLGGTIAQEEPDWVVVRDDRGRRLAFQEAPEHEPPRFPDPRGSQQFHLDLEVEDIEEAEKQVLALGATRVVDAHEDEDFRVFRDPAGHPFCLVYSVDPLA